jgi:glycosidase
MPIHPIGVEKRKQSPGSPYAVRNYYEVNPRFGSMEDFKSLVKAVHDRGMHIIIDMVLNHSSWDNPLMQDHPDWYSRNEAGEVLSPNESWWDTADLNYDSKELQQWMIEMLRWWIEETDIDGFRFDVAELVPNEFWVQAKEACKAVKPDVFFLAEGDKPYLHLNGHDMTYSWNIWEHLIDVAKGENGVSALKQSYENEIYQYPENALRMRFTENHDKTRSHRLIGDKELNKTAWAFIALMKGNPLIYAGQEIGAVRQADIHIDPVIYWSRADRDLELAMGEILGLRKAWIKPESEFEIILASDEKQVIAYKHGPLLTFFNFSDENFEFSATGMDSIMYGGIKSVADGKLLLSAKSFGVIK